MQEVGFFHFVTSSYKKLHTAFIFTQELGACVVPKLRYENGNYHKCTRSMHKLLIIKVFFQKTYILCAHAFIVITY